MTSSRSCLTTPWHAMGPLTVLPTLNSSELLSRMLEVARPDCHFDQDDLVCIIPLSTGDKVSSYQLPPLKHTWHAMLNVLMSMCMSCGRYCLFAPSHLSAGQCRLLDWSQGATEQNALAGLLCMVGLTDRSPCPVEFEAPTEPAVYSLVMCA